MSLYFRRPSTSPYAAALDEFEAQITKYLRETGLMTSRPYLRDVRTIMVVVGVLFSVLEIDFFGELSIVHLDNATGKAIVCMYNSMTNKLGSTGGRVILWSFINQINSIFNLLKTKGIS